MELRHLRYLVAAADAGSLSDAAVKTLHTAQPSLSRQLRDLESEVGVQLFTRHARGIEITKAGEAFLVHARLALAQAAEAVNAARRVARPTRPVFSIGFLTGQEVDWLPHVTAMLRDELPTIEFKVMSLYSPDLADAIAEGHVDLGFLRVEPRKDVTYHVIAEEPLVAVMSSDNALAAQNSVDPAQLVSETYIGYSDAPHVLRDVVDRYLRDRGIDLVPSHRIDNFAMGISLVASVRGVALLPAYVEPLLPWSVVSRPLRGVAPTIELAIGYRADNRSPTLKTFLGRIDKLTDAVPAGLRVGNTSRPQTTA